MVVKNKPDHRLRRIVFVLALQKGGELPASVAIFDIGENLSRMEIQSGQNGDRS